MNTYTLLHNPRCSKSRQGLEILQKSGKEFSVIEYLKEGQTLDFDNLKKIRNMLGGDIMQMVRRKEKFWKEEGIDLSSLSEAEILEILLTFPRGIERPILIKNDKKAVIGRPPENFLKLVMD